jgi:peptidoglycan hydrolase-like protein with peptidoglycan-binding domain
VQIGLVPDGTATASLQEILFSVYAPSFDTSTQSNIDTYAAMYPGRKDDTVGVLQKRLVTLGFLSTDGTTYNTYDNNTVNAVKRVQQKMGITVDGLASPELQAFLLSNYGMLLK